MKKISFKFFIASVFCMYAITANSQYTWTQKADLPSNARAYAASFSIGHYGYVGCGYNLAGSEYSDWWRWNQNTNTWSAIASYPGAGQIGCTSFSVNGNGYVGLGSNGSSVKTDLWRYDTTSNSWTAMASFPSAARYRAIAFVIGTNAYVCTGSPGAPPYLSDCWKYNTLTNAWTQIASFPLANHQVDMVFSDGKFGYGGFGGTGGPGSFNNSMYKYDTTSNTWNAVDSLPLGDGIANQEYFMLGDTAYTVSGIDNPGYYLQEVYSYNVNVNTWTTLPSFPGMPRQVGVGFSIGNKGYIATGYDSLGVLHNDLWQYANSSTSGVNHPINSNNILVYPNPANNEVYVQINGNGKADLLQLYTITGQKLLEQKASAQYSTLNIQSLPVGVYFLRVQMQDGNTMVKKVEVMR